MSKRSIRLRPVLDEDSSVLFEWINDRDLVVFNSPYRPVSEAEHRAWFESLGERVDRVFFIIEDVETSSAIGSCQLLNIHPLHQTAELQIRIGRQNFQNAGAGSDAVRQLVTFGFKKLNLRRIALQVFATNDRAIRVYEKNGFVREGLLREAACIDGRWVDIVCMAKMRSEDA